MPRTVDVSDLPQAMVEAIEAMVRAWQEQPCRETQRRSIGWAKNVLPELPASFFEDLPSDMLDQFEVPAA